MLENVIEDSEFGLLMQKHMQEMVLHFFKKEQNFGILCKIEEVSFQPDLSDDIISEFRPLTLFFLAGYTFETAHIEDNHLVFEAGFGADNFACLVSLPLLSIIQIIVDETPVFINLARYKEEKKIEEKLDENGVKSSMESFLSNPENSKFVKK